ncbi:MAG: NYN domain-containing protein [Proteobacteria bacterium]|nr:NYN domain-containing protein [Pseudomonadota bacterium]
MTHLIIDGYNYINRIRTSPAGEGSNLDMLRRSLLDRFVQYKKLKRVKLTVVFDAYNSFSPGRQRENYKGIDVVYSGEKETADDVIIGWIREKRAGIVAVSSDRAIIDEAKRHGVAFLTPPGMEALMVNDVSGKDGESDETDRQSAKKKGNPRKLPKKLRKSTKTIGKI